MVRPVPVPSSWDNLPGASYRQTWEPPAAQGGEMETITRTGVSAIIARDQRTTKPPSLPSNVQQGPAQEQQSLPPDTGGSWQTVTRREGRGKRSQRGADKRYEAPDPKARPKASTKGKGGTAGKGKTKARPSSFDASYQAQKAYRQRKD